VDPKRLRLEWISASEGQKFANTVNEFVKDIRAMGPAGFGRK
jgi:coenzyme F420-reducing hydrogenase delta subunit